MDSQTVAPETGHDDRHLRKSLGYWQLTAIGFSGVIGSGWLLGAMYAAQYAGPEAVVSWMIGGVVLALIAYALPSVSAVVFARGAAFPGGAPRWIRYLAPVAFALATLIIYWAGWHELRIALPILLIGVLVYAYQHWRVGAEWADARLGLWLVAYLALVLLMSAIGSAAFEGTNAVPAPWDSVIVAVIALAAWLSGVKAGRRYLAANPAPAAETAGDAPTAA